MKFSDDLLKSVSTILEAKPRVSFDGDKATVHSKNGTPMKSFNKSDLGNSYRKHADNFLSNNYKKLNAESVIVEELVEGKSDNCKEGEFFCTIEKKCKPIPKGMKLEGEKVVKEAKQLELPGMEKKPQQMELDFGDKKKKDKKAMKESEDLNTDNAAKATMHDCAKHVRHEEHGLGQCISTMHTLEEDEDGNGYVTHYDVMFQGEDGPFIIEDVWVEDLEIISEMHHGHPKGKKKKMKEEVEAIDEKKGHKKDKGDMDGDGVDEPDDKEYMDNKDKAIKMAMSKKKSESPIKKVEEAKMVPGFIGADGKATSKPTQKDYDSNKEYQSMKKKLGDKIPGPKPVNKEHLDSISAALQEISNKTLHSYISKASDPKNKKGVLQQAKKSEYKEKQYREPGDDGGDVESKRAVNREKGIRTAVSKLSMSGQKSGAKKADKNPRPASQTNEHIESISERNTEVKLSDKKIKMKTGEFKPIPGHPDYKGPQNPTPKIKLNKSPGNMKKESSEYMDDLADRIRSHENKKERKKAEKAFTSGDYEKATGHIGGTYREGPQ